jgi:uncharacterized membrane protein HdeD (DUF308 family)
MSGVLKTILIPWWLVLLEGILSVILGVWFFTSPFETLIALVSVVGFFWMFGGLMRIISLFVDSTDWVLKLITGAIGIIAGLAVLKHPVLAGIAVPGAAINIAAILGVLFGILTIVLAFNAKSWGLGLLGVVYILLSVFVMKNLGIAITVLPMILGISAIIGGVGAIFHSFEVKKIQDVVGDLKK